MNDKINKLWAEPLISIIVPVFNAEPYLKSCCKSLQEQSYVNLEIIFVDDCSTDDSVHIIEELQTIDSRIVLYRLKHNGGVSNARNFGLDQAKGDYIGFCDADDYCEKDMFLHLINAIRKEKADISCCALKKVNSGGVVLETLWEAPKNLCFTSEKALKNWLIGRYIGNSVYTKLFSKKLWDEIRFPVGEIFEEAYVLPMLILKSQKIVHTGYADYKYYERDGSYTQKQFGKEKLIVLRRQAYVEKLVLEKYPTLTKAMECFKIRNALGLYISAILSKKQIEATLMSIVKNNFNTFYKTALKNPFLSPREKLKIIEVKFHIFEIRKR